MKTKIALAVALLMGAALAWDWWQQGGSPAPMVVEAPALPADVASLLDKEKPYTVVHAWATWCPPCMAEMPGLLDEAKAGRTKVALVLLSADTSSTVLDGFYRKSAVNPTDTRTATWLHDPSQTLIRQLDSQPVKLPMTVAYTKDGATVQVIRSRVEWRTFLDALEAR
jgi:thiol-disulfide isomerase/thioredoxin